MSRRYGASPRPERGCLFQLDGIGERIGMPMRQPPFGPFVAIDQGDAQRPILRRQAFRLRHVRVR